MRTYPAVRLHATPQPLIIKAALNFVARTILLGNVKDFKLVGETELVVDAIEHTIYMFTQRFSKLGNEYADKLKGIRICEEKILDRFHE